MADRGFASYNVFAHALDKGCFFVIRAKDLNLKRLLAVDCLPDRIYQWAEVILTRSNARKKRLHPEWESLYRYICKEVPFDFITDRHPEYHMQLRVVRFQIAQGVYENIITNLPEVPIKKEQRKWAYQVNLSMAIKICFAFLSDRMGARNINDLISRHILPIRPDRTYARRPRFQVPASFAYRFV